MACSSFNLEKLINLVQKYQFQFDKNCKYYCNSTIRENAWSEISNSLGNTTGNYIILFSVIYILCNFCNVLQLWNFTIMTIISIINNVINQVFQPIMKMINGLTQSILKQLIFAATRCAAPHALTNFRCVRNATHCICVSRPWHSSPPVCHSENADPDRTGVYCVRKDGNHWARSPGHRVDDD